MMMTPQKLAVGYCLRSHELVDEPVELAPLVPLPAWPVD
jgi:hypothetical protein